MAKADEVLRNIYDKEGNTIGVSGTTYSGGVPSQLITTQDLATGALNYTTAVGSNFIVKGIYFVFSGSVTQDITIEYNGVPLREYTITGGTTSYVTGDFSIQGANGKELTITCTNNVTPAIVLTLTIDVEVV